MNNNKACVVIPTYNNGGTLRDVVERVLRYCADVIVVNDGCTDGSAEILGSFGDRVTVVDYGRNRGKGYALKQGFRKAKDLGFDYALTIDSDGQHFPEDIPLFFKALEQHPGALIVGSRNLNQENMPGGNTFANKFSNFWFKIQTGISLPDTQTGYRLYPLRRLPRIFTSRYEAELALLVFSAWRGTDLIPVKINVFYPKGEERVTHFRPFWDFFRISVLNTVLCVAAMIYGYPSRLIHKMLRRNKA
ncbi:MAG: glycosyltransferase family 2 protein [Bacteroidales bacterium]|nr:glycosyltransferase family 2 protein [Bacteroidales bacterium]